MGELYRLKYGNHTAPVEEKVSGGGTRIVRKRLKPGDTCELSPQAARAFGDRFEKASSQPPKAEGATSAGESETASAGGDTGGDAGGASGRSGGRR